MSSLWYKKHMATTLDEYVFTSEDQKKRVMAWIEQGSIPMLLLHGKPGTGKTTLGYLLLKLLDVHPSDIKFINASMYKQNGVEYISETISDFCDNMPYGNYRYIFLDEGDRLSMDSQQALRGIIDTYSESARFIITCNYPHKIIEPLKSRLQQLEFSELDKNDFFLRVATILLAEQVEINPDILEKIVNDTYPDLRRCINECESNSVGGVLKLPTINVTDSEEYLIDAIACFRNKQYKDGREIICRNVKSDDYDTVFRFMYNNVGLWADTDLKMKKCIREIRTGIDMDSRISDREINLSATLISLEMISDGTL